MGEAKDVVAVPSVNQDGDSGQTSPEFAVHDEDAAVEATTKALAGIHGNEGAAERAEALVRGRQVEPETADDVAPKARAKPRASRPAK